MTSSVVGAVNGLTTGATAGSLSNIKFAHVMVGNKAGWEYANSTFAQSSIAYMNEPAARRFLRVCQEEGIAARVVGWPKDSEIMGPQPAATLQSILDECVALDIAKHPQTILAYELNGQELPIQSGAPLRVRFETKLGFKMVKYLRSIEFTDDYRKLGDGMGGIQMKRTPGSPTSTAAIHDAAARGVSTTASALPFHCASSRSNASPSRPSTNQPLPMTRFAASWSSSPSAALTRARSLNGTCCGVATP